MSERCSVSVLLPVHRVDEPVFESALRSVLLQSHPVDQLVVVDDSGFGAHEALIRAVVTQSGSLCSLTYIRNDRNLGVVESLNIGLAACVGEVVARMDADDIALPHRIEAQLALLSQGFDVVGGGIIKFGNGVGLIPVRYPCSSIGLLVAFLRSCPFAHPAVMFRRQRIQALGGYGNVRHAEDLDLWVRCLASGLRMTNIAMPVLLYRQHAQQVSVLNQKAQLSAAKSVRAGVLSALWTRLRRRSFDQGRG